MNLVATASQTVGPYFHIGLDRLCVSDLAGNAPGEKLVIRGRVLDGDGKPVNDALIELWQADPHGKFGQAGFAGFGRVATDDGGGFRFTTLKPGTVPGPGNSQQAPHLNLIVFSRGLLTHAFTRVYFNDEDEANDLDPILNLVDPARRGTIIAQRDKDAPHPTYKLDIHLQGDNETVFLEA